MINCMLHEDYYVSGQYIDEESGVYAGWVCHPKSYCDCMPVTNEKKDVVLVFFGENYFEKEYLTKLKSKNHVFDPSNASCIVHLYEEDPDGFPEQMNGWFCGLLIDRKRGKALLFNDCNGMQRLYIYEDKEAFYFSSEAKSLLHVFKNARVFNEQSLAEYVLCDCVLENRSLYRDISILPGGSKWKFWNDGIIDKGTYSPVPMYEKLPWLEEEFFYDRFKNMLPRIFSKYFRSEQTVGLSLTGDLDTRIILACLDIAPEKIPSYTFNGVYRECFDVKIARKVAKVTGQAHQVISIEEDFFKNFQSLSEKSIYISDGNLDVRGATELYVNKRARAIAPVRLTGNHGSEIVRGVRFLRCKYPRNHFYHRDFRKYLDAAAATYRPPRRFEPRNLQRFHRSAVVSRKPPLHRTIPIEREIAISRQGIGCIDVSGAAERSVHERFIPSVHKGNQPEAV